MADKEAERKAIVSAEAEVAEAEDKKAALAHRVEALEAMLAEEKRENAQLEQELKSDQAQTDERVELLQRGLKAFERLGLSFERVGGESPLLPSSDGGGCCSSCLGVSAGFQP